MTRFFNTRTILRLLFALSLVGAVLYFTRPEAREYLNRRLAWVKSAVAQYAPGFGDKVEPVTSTSPPQGTPPAEEALHKQLPATPRPLFSPHPTASKEEPRAPVLPANPFDLAKVCEDAARWPKTVRLKAPVEFPAVINGHVAGKLIAPAGVEVRVVKVSSAKVGVEYHGGGAWLDFQRTDFVERAQLAWR